MSIRTRLTLWYAAVMFVSLVAMGGLTYREFAPEPRRPGSAPAAERGEEVSDESDFAEVLRILLWCGVPAALLALGGGWWLMRQALSPVAALTQAAERVNERNLAEQLPRTGSGDELDRLTEVFNAMTARLNGSFQRIREFTLHASHELKTPLTVLRSEAETALDDPALAVAQRERLLSQLDELRRLTRIVDGLTLLTKADAGQVALHPEPVRLDELVRDCFADTQILAAPTGIAVELAACEAATVRGDRHRLRQLLLNLADNAVKYNAPQGRITMALRVTGRTRSAGSDAPTSQESPVSSPGFSLSGREAGSESPEGGTTNQFGSRTATRDSGIVETSPDPRGGRREEARSSPARGNQSLLTSAATVFTLTNTGPGIPPEILPRLFDRFFRGDASHNHDVEGCGLGLSIAQWIVSAHKGTIQIASVPSQLTIVTVRLPLASLEVPPA